MSSDWYKVKSKKGTSGRNILDRGNGMQKSPDTKVSMSKEVGGAGDVAKGKLLRLCRP